MALGHTSEVAELLKLWDKDYEEAKKGMEKISAFMGDSLSMPLSQLNAVVHEKMGSLRSHLMNLEIALEEQDCEDEGEAAQKLLQKQRGQLDKLRTDLRAANVQAKLNVDKIAQDEREELLGAGESGVLRKRQLRTQADMAAASESITESLRRVRQVMVQELDHGANTLAVMDESNASMLKTDQEYSGHRSLLGRTRQLLSTLQRQEVAEKFLLAIGVFFFTLVCLYILKKRLLPAGKTKTSSDKQ